MVLLAQADALRIPLADQSVDLIVGSPPYIDCRTYLEDGRDLGIARKCEAWVEWMLEVTAEAVRVSRGPVIWVVAGKTEDRRYQPGPEGLVWEWYRRGGAMECPCYWHRYGIPGSGGDQWFRKDIEYAICFKRDLIFPHSDNTAMGMPPRFGPGGAMSNRDKMGRRVNQWGGNGAVGSRKASGDRDGKIRPSHVMGIDSPGVIANPGNLLSTGASGGNNLGHPLAHENEAPYPEDVPEFFIRSFTRPGGIVLDPFSGSGTTVSVAEQHGRIGIGLDLRRSQAEIARRRVERPHAPVIKRHKAATEVHPLFDEAIP